LDSLPRRRQLSKRPRNGLLSHIDVCHVFFDGGLLDCRVGIYPTKKTAYERRLVFRRPRLLLRHVWHRSRPAFARRLCHVSSDDGHLAFILAGVSLMTVVLLLTGKKREGYLLAIIAFSFFALSVVLESYPVAYDQVSEIYGNIKLVYFVAIIAASVLGIINSAQMYRESK